MTDLEKHVNRPGRDKLVKKVREKINELGITYIYYQFISVTGRVVGKGIPADHWERTAEKGFQLVYGATANLFLIASPVVLSTKLVASHHVPVVAAVISGATESILKLALVVVNVFVLPALSVATIVK